MRTTLLGVVLAISAGYFATTAVWASPINGAAIGEAISSSLLTQKVEHRRDESRERRHRREESRERRHRREESRERR